MWSPRHPRRASLRLALLVLVVALPSITGCGSDGDGETPTTPVRESGATIDSPRDLIVTREDIARAGNRSPAATVLSWWQSVQFQDAQRARSLYAKRVDVKRLPADIRDLSAFFVGARPVISQTDIRGERARVLALVQSATFAEGKGYVSETPTTFQLAREDGGWRLADDRFMASRRQAQEAAERAQDQNPAGR